jgi:hypothetical protein
MVFYYVNKQIKKYKKKDLIILLNLLTSIIGKINYDLCKAKEILIY